MSGDNGNGKPRPAPRHPIGVVSGWTGLSPDLLRVWERRYGVVSPERTASGQRLYSDADVERLRLLQQATSRGRGISQLAKLGEDELRSLVAADTAADPTEPSAQQAPADAEAWIALAMERAGRLDGACLEQLLRRLAALWGTVVFLESFLAPLLRRIGEAWHAGMLKPHHEHLTTAVVRSVLMGLASELSPATSAPGLLVATPSEERHEVGALLVAAAAAAAGWRVTYLGPDLPASDIAEAALQAGVRAVALSVVLPRDSEHVVREIREVRERLPAGIDVLVGGGGAARLDALVEAPGIAFPGDLPALRNWLRHNA
jgi:MerR family transcriptional regulator, light-induced transcriptional regulator